MRLFELFNTNASLNKFKLDSNGNGAQYSGTLSDGSFLTVTFEDCGEGHYYLEFRRGEDFEDATINKNGMGNPAQVFGVVVQVIRQFIDEYQPHVIDFRADQSGMKVDGSVDARSASRSNLYTSMLKRMCPSNYTYTVEQGEGDDEDDYLATNIEFRIMRKDS